MLDMATYPLRAVPAPGLPITEMVVGKPVEEAADMLPRIFNLCREAQGIAARAAFGLSLADGWDKKLRAEIVREHVVKLCLKWPGLLSQPALPLPRDWQRDDGALRRALFGDAREMPHTKAQFDNWIAGSNGIAPTLRALSLLFALGEAVRSELPRACATTLFADMVQENSIAARHADHPVMRAVEADWGRGPLWSALGVAFDIDAVLRQELPMLYRRDGYAVVPAARGLYGVRAQVTDGLVRAFQRITPTDHLLASNGALAQVLASMSRTNSAARAPLLLSVMDPCFPVSLQTAKELTDA